MQAPLFNSSCFTVSFTADSFPDESFAMFAKYCNKELTEPLFGHLLQPPIFLPENMNKIQNYLFKNISSSFAILLAKNQ